VENFPRAAVERAMKVQDVMLRAMAKRITCGKQWRSSGLATGRRGVGGDAKKSTVMKARFEVWNEVIEVPSVC